MNQNKSNARSIAVSLMLWGRRRHRGKHTQLAWLGTTADRSLKPCKYNIFNVGHMKGGIIEPRSAWLSTVTAIGSRLLDADDPRGRGAFGGRLALMKMVAKRHEDRVVAPHCENHRTAP
jgi:hypothetical protein